MVEIYSFIENIFIWEDEHRTISSSINLKRRSLSKNIGNIPDSLLIDIIGPCLSRGSKDNPTADQIAEWLNSIYYNKSWLY